MAKGALTGSRVADFSWVIAGPMATKALAGMGAEVIKIESHVRPEFVHRDPLFDVVNNSKKSVALDLARPEAREIVEQIIARSDILVENFSAGVMGRWGLDYESVRKIRPDIIYVSGSGVGREGPQRDVLAYGSLLEAFSGRANLVCRGAINSRMEAMGIMPAWTDPATAMWEVFAILLAVHNRHQTGEGAFIDLSMIESTIALFSQSLIAHQSGQAVSEPGLNQEHGAAPSGCFRCGADDEWLALSICSDAEWRTFCSVIGQPHLTDDPRFQSQQQRVAALAELNAIIAKCLSAADIDELEQKLRSAGVNASRSRNMADIMADPVVEASGVFQQQGLSHRTTSLPWVEADGWRGEFLPAPRLGEHSLEILRDLLAVNDDRIARLHQDGAVYAAALAECSAVAEAGVA